MAFTWSSRRVDVGDVSLEVAEAGAGGRPLLLVHGFTGAKEDFTDWLEPLAEQGWHAVAPDLRGHGASDHPAGEQSYGLAIYAGDVLRLADVLGFHDFVLLGHSMGGMVAQRVAIEAPERVRALVLMDTSHGPPEGVDPEMVGLGVAVVRAGGIPALVEATRNLPGALDTPADQRLRRERPGYVEFGERKMLACSADMWLAMVDELFSQHDRLEALSSFPAPTLVMVGEQDQSFLAPAERMAAAIPRARLVVIADAGHSPQFENPDVWWGALCGFLADLKEDR